MKRLLGEIQEFYANARRVAQSKVRSMGCICGRVQITEARVHRFNVGVRRGFAKGTTLMNDELMPWLKGLVVEAANKTIVPLLPDEHELERLVGARIARFIRAALNFARVPLSLPSDVFNVECDPRKKWTSCPKLDYKMWWPLGVLCFREGLPPPITAPWKRNEWIEFLLTTALYIEFRIQGTVYKPLLPRPRDNK